MNWYFEVIRKYAVFDGRAHRTEYWMFFLINFLIGAAFYVAGLAVPEVLYLYGLYSLVLLIPGLAVGARRLHDTNRSGWWLLVGIVPIIGAIVLIIFLVQDSQPGSNQYGANPKAVTV